MRNRMRDASIIDSYAPAFGLNGLMTGDTMSIVIKTNNSDYKVGDFVYGCLGRGLFEEYSKVSAEYADFILVRNDTKYNGLPHSCYVGVLAMPGLTAYYSLKEIGKTKIGETIYISAAAGAVGQLVGQFVKALGLYVVGSAGSDDKVEHIKSIGSDAAFNYKKGDIEKNLRKHCPSGIDIYFEGVGGKMLDAVLVVANNFGRIIASGMISQYNLTKPEPLYKAINIVTKRIKFNGFIIVDHMDYEEKFLKEVTPLLVNGSIEYRESVAEGIEALIDVLHSKNFGKQLFTLPICNLIYELHYPI